MLKWANNLLLSDVSLLKCLRDFLLKHANINLICGRIGSEPN